MRIFTPIIINIIPPRSSGFNLWVIIFPNLSPKWNPIMLKTNDTSPMIISGSVSCGSSEYPVQAKDMPTARASILVAMANNN
jgi:hypothetical protein